MKSFAYYATPLHKPQNAARHAKILKVIAQIFGQSLT